VSIGWVCSIGGPLTVDGGSLCLSLVLLFGMCVGRRELLPTPLREAHWMSRPQEKRQQKRVNNHSLLALYAIMFIELCFNFVCFLHVYPSCGQLLFLCLASSLSCAGRLRRCHMSYGSRHHISVQVGSGAATCLVAQDLMPQA
jgi:hypothetical protein